MTDPKLLKSAHHILRIHTKALGLAPGSAEVFINRSIKAAEKTLKNHTVVTEKDLNHAIAKELIKYNADLAYVYKNYDKII